MAGRDYRLANRAILDLQEIAEYLAERSETAAERVFSGLHETFSEIARSEGIGTSLDRYRPGLRMSIGNRPAQKYVIFHRATGDRVMITRVLHAARNWIAVLAEDEE
ncbi:MAG: type II toxin-antitoxin system RelE/ParE family toxin [Pirellulales bacterium]